MSSSAAYQLVRLANGAFSIHSIAHRETFHPVVGPAAEAEALYVKQLQMDQRLKAHAGDFVLWDIGLGAAANVLTLFRATRHIPCRLRVLSFDRTIESLRFALEHAERLPYLEGYQDCCAQLLRISQNREPSCVFRDGAREIQWDLHLGDFPTLLMDPSAQAMARPHAVLFDPFSPRKNPEMWTLPLFKRIFDLRPASLPCVLATYSRSTWLRVSLLLAGFFVGRGDATGEKEETTIASNTTDSIRHPLDAAWLRRAKNSTSAEPLREPTYGQAPIDEGTWAELLRHPQFASLANNRQVP